MNGHRSRRWKTIVSYKRISDRVADTNCLIAKMRRHPRAQKAAGPPANQPAQNSMHRFAVNPWRYRWRDQVLNRIHLSNPSKPPGGGYKPRDIQQRAIYKHDHFGPNVPEHSEPISERLECVLTSDADVHVMVPIQTLRKGVCLSTEDNGPDSAIAESSDEFEEMFLAASVAHRIRDEQYGMTFRRLEAVTCHILHRSTALPSLNLAYVARNNTLPERRHPRVTTLRTYWE